MVRSGANLNRTRFVFPLLQHAVVCLRCALWRLGQNQRRLVSPAAHPPMGCTPALVFATEADASFHSRRSAVTRRAHRRSRSSVQHRRIRPARRDDRGMWTLLPPNLTRMCTCSSVSPPGRKTCSPSIGGVGRNAPSLQHSRRSTICSPASTSSDLARKGWPSADKPPQRPSTRAHSPGPRLRISGNGSALSAATITLSLHPEHHISRTPGMRIAVAETCDRYPQQFKEAPIHQIYETGRDHSLRPFLHAVQYSEAELSRRGRGPLRHAATRRGARNGASRARSTCARRSLFVRSRLSS